MVFYISGPKLLFETTEISTRPNSTQQESNYNYLYTTKFGTSIKIRLNRKFESTEFETTRVNYICFSVCQKISSDLSTVAPSYETTPTKGKMSNTLRYSKILLNCPSQERPHLTVPLKGDHPSYKATFSLQNAFMLAYIHQLNQL